LAVLWEIKDLAICISKDFRSISKYFFGRFVEYQGFASEKVWKSCIFGSEALLGSNAQTSQG